MPVWLKDRCYTIACSYALCLVAPVKLSLPDIDQYIAFKTDCKNFFALNAFFLCPFVVASKSPVLGLPTDVLFRIPLFQAASNRFTLAAASIHFLVVFHFQNATASLRSPPKFKVRFMSAQYVKLCCYVSSQVRCANYERAICQESEAEQSYD